MRGTSLLIFGGLAVGLSLAEPQVKAQTKEPVRLTFDVASIRLSKSETLDGGIKPLDGGHGYTVSNVPVKLMIALMYKVPMRQINGGPAWLDGDRYDIEARADGSYNLDDLHTMFQNLLADRFGLIFHKDVKAGPIFALTVNKAGLKMTPNDGPNDFSIPVTFGADWAAHGRRVPMVYLSWFLGQLLQREGRPVVDRTGLKGNFDFTLLFQPILPKEVSVDTLSPEQQARPALLDALPEQLGLRLTRQAKGPIEFYGIDHIDRPSAN